MNAQHRLHSSRAMKPQPTPPRQSQAPPQVPKFAPQLSSSQFHRHLSPTIPEGHDAFAARGQHPRRHSAAMVACAGVIIFEL